MGGIAGGSGDVVGGVRFIARSVAPYGWLKANGAEVSRATYAALFAVIGTEYGPGDGVNTFNLPDLRGEFIRGFDDGRGVDAGRVLGSAQADELKSHTHTVDVLFSVGGGSPTLSGDTSASPKTTSATGGTETRPRNVAMLACIKY